MEWLHKLPALLDDRGQGGLIQLIAHHVDHSNDGLPLGPFNKVIFNTIPALIFNTIPALFS